MDTPVLIDFHTVARQIVKISDIRKKETLTSQSPVQAKDFSREDYRYFTITALIATAIEPSKSAAVTKRLLSGLDRFETDMLDGLPSSVSEHRREVFVAEFLKYEYRS
jgi:hypothetical protein